MEKKQVFSSYAIQAIMSFLMLAIIFVMYPRAAVSANRINEVLDKEELIKGGEQSLLPSNDCSIEFKNVYFKYPDSEEYILQNISSPKAYILLNEYAYLLSWYSLGYSTK